jgi:hypothetical protein
MKVELDLPEIPGYEYTGEFRPPVKGEVCLMFGKPVREQEKYNTGNASYPILQVKEKPRIIIYQWLINHNTSNDPDDVFDVGYRVINSTEDYVVGCAKIYGWTYKKMSNIPVWSFDGDTL